MISNSRDGKILLNILKSFPKRGIWMIRQEGAWREKRKNRKKKCVVISTSINYNSIVWSTQEIMRPDHGQIWSTSETNNCKFCTNKEKLDTFSETCCCNKGKTEDQCSYVEDELCHIQDKLNVNCVFTVLFEGDMCSAVEATLIHKVSCDLFGLLSPPQLLDHWMIHDISHGSNLF